jgi:hypothetical protein
LTKELAETFCSGDGESRRAQRVGDQTRVIRIYLAGFGLQFEGENYFVPVDADIQRDVDVPLQAVRVSDFTQPLAALPDA